MGPDVISCDIMVYERLYVIVQVFGSRQMDMSNSLDLLRVAKHPIEVKIDEWFTWGSRRRHQEGANYLLGNFW